MLTQRAAIQRELHLASLVGPADGLERRAVVAALLVDVGAGSGEQADEPVVAAVAALAAQGRGLQRGTPPPNEDVSVGDDIEEQFGHCCMLLQHGGLGSLPYCPLEELAVPCKLGSHPVTDEIP